MAHVADEVLWNDLVNSPVVVHLRGTTNKAVVRWLKDEYWEGRCTMSDAELGQKLEMAQKNGLLRRRRFHGLIKMELRTLQHHERVALQRHALRKAQHLDRKVSREAARQARNNPATFVTPPCLEVQIEQCWGELTADQRLRYPAAA